MSIDAEWVQNSPVAVALLQISFPNGKSYLISHRFALSQKFLNILEDDSIIKIGIGILDEDVKRFRSQWNIQPRGLVELGHLAKKYYPELEKLGAQYLAQTFLDVTLDKNWRL